MRTEHDMTANALYIALRDESVASTTELEPGTLIDVDAQGQPIGVEVINPARGGWLDIVLQRFGSQINADDRQLMLELFGQSARDLTRTPVAQPSLQAEVLIPT